MQIFSSPPSSFSSVSFTNWQTLSGIKPFLPLSPLLSHEFTAGALIVKTFLFHEFTTGALILIYIFSLEFTASAFIVTLLIISPLVLLL